ncbi:MAG: hypothetical protein KGN79_02130 [Acidobacteriota bacterium]|nr:hypothetical protein [Acidobacteriota bacterium]
MIFFVEVSDANKISTQVELLTRVVWPALAALVPTAAIGAFKWLGEHSSKRRAAVLSDRVAALAKQIADLPALPLDKMACGTSPQSALTSELDFALRELSALQAKVNLRHRLHIFSTTAKIREALLLYRPKGKAAWLLHLTFYLYSVCFFILICLVPNQQDSFIVNLGWVTAFTIVLGIPPLIMQHYAARIRARQCIEQTSSATKNAVSTAY